MSETRPSGNLIHVQCRNCNTQVSEEDTRCPGCGIPLPPNHAKRRQRRFLVMFILVVLFCIIMMLWLPPDWSNFIS